MHYLLYIFSFLFAFVLMEFAAWFAHKFIMHGSFWFLHKDHHDEGYKVLQKNDSFALFFAIPSWLSIMLGVIYESNVSIWFGSGIAAFGVSYFVVHEIFIHQRIKFFRNSDNWYLRALRRAHKVHHKKLTKEDGECFGMLLVPLKYFKEEMIKANSKT
jgi:beta-carotene 3-hydroxylase